jgi:transcriptional regulator with XRE-family HTH domain
MRVLESEDVIRLLRSEVEPAGSQVAFASEAGVDRATISKILRGRAPLQPKILRALNVRMVYVLASKNEPLRKHPISRSPSKAR